MYSPVMISVASSPCSCLTFLIGRRVYVVTDCVDGGASVVVARAEDRSTP